MYKLCMQLLNNFDNPYHLHRLSLSLQLLWCFVFISSGYVDELMARVLMRVKAGKTTAGDVLEELQPQPPLCAEFDRPDKKEAIAQYNDHRRYREGNDLTLTEGDDLTLTEGNDITLTEAQ